METSKERYIPALGYRLLTPLYDPVVALTCREKTFKGRLLEQAGIQAGHHVLDVGCGTGTLATQIKQSTPRAKVVSIDGDPQVLAIAKHKAASHRVQVHFCCCLSSQLPFRDGAFDRAVTSLFFHHLMTDQKTSTAREVLRVLEPGAEFHVADWGRPTNALMRLLFYGIQILDGFANTTDHVKGRLPSLLHECGFQQCRLRESFSTMWGTMTLYSARKPDQAPWMRQGGTAAPRHLTQFRQNGPCTRCQRSGQLPHLHQHRPRIRTVLGPLLTVVGPQLLKGPVQNGLPARHGYSRTGSAFLRVIASGPKQ